MSNVRIKCFFEGNGIVSLQKRVNSWIEEGYKEEKVFIDFPNSKLFIKEIIKETIQSTASHYITIIYEVIE